jgi:hypothetical protein
MRTTTYRPGTFRPRPMLWLLALGAASWLVVIAVLRLGGAL